MALLKKFWSNEDGATAIEYGLIAALIAIAATGGMVVLGESVDGLFQLLADFFDSNNTIVS